MICYMDMTFCNETTCSKFGDGDKDCPRSLTLAIEHMASYWWNQGTPKKNWSEAPICVFINRPDCFESKPSPSD